MAEAQAQDDADENENFVDELKPGTKLMHGQYTIDSFLNAGGFGITYLAKDSLDRKVVIKECFPGAFCRRSRYVVQARSRAHQNELKSIVRLFVQEARSLAKLDHPNIVGVHQVFEDNDTAYMALDFVEGRDLLDIIEDPNETMTPDQVKSILRDVLGAVGFIHDQGILHRDISPDNILINQDKVPVLIDFGAAREEATKQSRVLSALRVVKDGYSPQEFYIAGSEQDASSDLYALAASFYHLINGDVPPNSQARLASIAAGEADSYVPLAGRFPDYDDNFLGAIDKALAVLPKDRVQSAQAWLDMMEAKSGNVTPLKVASTSSAPAAGKAPAAEPAKKSNMPILLGSVAVVALLGVGAVTMMGGGEEAPAAPEVTTPTTTETATAETPVEETTEVPAPTETADTVAEDASTEETAVTEDAAAETADPVVTEEVATTEDTTVAETTDAEAVEAALAEAVEEAPEVAAAPAEEPLPEPVETPRPTTLEPELVPTLPEQTASVPTADSDTPEVALPDAPATVAEVASGLDLDIRALVPGNEIPPAAVEAGWTVRLPFIAESEFSNVVAEAGAVAPVWVQPGIQITGVNGTEVGTISEIPGVLQAAGGEVVLQPTVPVTFSTVDPASGASVDQAWILPVVQETMMVDGTRFETVYVGGDWETIVASLGPSQNGGLEIGDVVTSYIPTGETITGPTSMSEILGREIENGTEQLTFAVQRDGSLWVASLNFDDAGE